MSKKKIKGEDGKEYIVKEKKPFYKRWWFIGLVVIIVIGALASGGDEESADVADDQESTEQVEGEAEAEGETGGSEEATEEPQNLAMGESATIDDITVTVTDASFTDERNEFAEEDPEQVIAINYTLENSAEDDYPFGADMQVYVDGTQASSYPLGSDLGSVSSGRSVESTAYYGVNGEQVELEWQPMFSFDNERAIWDISVE